MGIKLKTLFNLMEINFHLSLSPNALPGAGTAPPIAFRLGNMKLLPGKSMNGNE